MSTPRPRRALTSLPLHVAALLGSATLGASLVLAPAPAALAATSGLCATPDRVPTATARATNGALGGTVTLTGSGWCHPDGSGSTIGVKIDEGSISRLDTSVHPNQTIWAVVQADADGSFSARITLPDGTAGTSTPALTAGQHTFRLLSGSLKPGDTGRTVLTPDFSVARAPVTAPTWDHQEITAGNTVTWIEDTVGTGDTATLRVRGQGWLRSNGTPSTVAVKLGRGGQGQYTRPAGEVITHPTAAGDTTIWALLVPGGSAQPHVFTMNPDGTFEATLDLPRGLVDGQFLSVTLTSGRFAAGDVQRNVTSKPLVVGSARGTEETASGGTCTPTSAQPSVTVPSAPVAPGGVLRVTGTGWCHPTAGGSVIGIKIDEGGYSRLDSAVHSNRTIWAIVRAADADGTFSADLRLPDGTTATSTPALPTGAHTLRLLSGSLKPGDSTRTLLSSPFVVGAYRPNGYPEPFDAAGLVDSARGGVAATRTGRQLSVYVASGRPGDWVNVSAYLPNSSPTYPWGGTWYQLNARNRVRLTIPRTAPQGPVKVVLTNGNQGVQGELLGWDDATFPVTATPPSDTDTDDPTDPTDDANAPSPGTDVPTTPAPGAPSAPDPTAPGPVTAPSVSNLLATPVDTPLTSPEPPAKNFVALGLLPGGNLTATLAGDALTVRFPRGRAGDLVHTRVYGADDVPAGWGTLGEGNTLVLALTDLPTGTYRLAFQGPDAKLIGWTEVEWTSTSTASTAAPAEPEAAQTRAVQQASTGWAPGAWDGILLGLGVAVVGITSLSRRRTGGAA